MRRRLRRLAVLSACVAVAVPAALAVTGTTAEPRDRLADVLVADPPISRDLAVVGVTDPRLWPTPPDGLATTLDSDRLRFRGLVRTLEAVLEHDPRLVVMTDVVTNEDLTEQDARALVEVLATGRVLLPYLDDVPVADGTSSGAVRRFRRPLGVTSGLPLAHAVVEGTSSGGPVRSVAVEERWSADGEDWTFVALPIAALSSVAAVPVSVEDDAVRAGSVAVPLEDGRLRINFTARLVDRVPGTTTPAATRDDAPFVAATDLLAGGTSTGATGLADRIVLVGSIDPLQARYVAVPSGPPAGVPEVWVHANAVNTVLVGAPLAPSTVVELVLWLVVAAAGATLLALRRPPVEAGLWLLPATAAALVAVGARGAAGTVVDGAAVLAALLLAWGGAVLARQAVEGRQQRQVAALFRRYVPDAVAAQLLEDEVDLRALAAGTREEVTVLFCDLRGFTSQAARLDPGHVRDLLNVYYRHATGVVLDHGGTVMQYVGDEVFAVFGAPLHQGDHAARAVAAARDLQTATGAIAADLAVLGVGPVTYGIGVHTGPVVAAHVGDAARTQYAVVGDTVNVGARLCSQAGAGEVVVSEDVLATLDPRPTTTPLGAVPLKGVERELAVHRLVQGSSTHVPDG